jgi:hypothetical protein
MLATDLAPNRLTARQARRGGSHSAIARRPRRRDCVCRNVLSTGATHRGLRCGA